MAVAATAFSQVSQAHVTFTYLGDLRSPAYRLADECFLPLAGVEEIGWHMAKTDEGLDVDAEGGHFKLPLRTINGRDCIPLGLAIDEMGGISQWNKEGGDHFSVYAKITSIQMTGTQLKIASSMDTKVSVIAASYPTRLIIDLWGAKVASSGDYSLDAKGRLGQFGPDDVRVVWENEQAVKPILPDPSRNFLLNLTSSTTPVQPHAYATPSAVSPAAKSSAANPGAAPMVPYANGPDQSFASQTPDPASTPEPPAPASGPPAPDPASADGAMPTPAPDTIPPPKISPTTPQPPTSFDPPTVVSENDDALTLSMAANGSVAGLPKVTHLDATTLQVVLPNSSMALPADFNVPSPSVVGTTATQQGADTVLVLKLARPMGAQAVVTGNEVRLVFLKPSVGNGKLAGKVIVVDPGHGGSDTGCDFQGQYFEKTFTLQIGKLVQADLEAAGATVIMTRTDDTYPTLPARSELANHNNADFFISIHINSNELMPNNRSGTTTYYHGGNDLDQILARCVQQEVVKVSGLPSLGIVNDFHLHPNKGLAVLRGTKPTIPSILIEVCYINNATDLQSLLTPAFQQNVAMGIVNGFKVYIGDAKTK
jgi:N-acetylmuramoyl-L-alanine amidase